jgi:hypothetical protein
MITIKAHKIKLTTEPQTSPTGRQFRLSGIKYDLTKPPKYANGLLNHATYYTFVYLDDNSFFGFYFDSENNFVEKLNHADILKFC